MPRPSIDMTFDQSIFASLIIQLSMSILGMIVNGTVLLCLVLRPQMRTQPNFLVANLCMADFLVCLCYGSLSILNLVYEMRPSIHLCMYIMAPALFALNVSLCCSVAVSHHRSTCCLLGYTSIHGVPNMAQRWQLMAASISVWLCTFLAGAAAFWEMGEDGAVPICVYPAALQNSYLVPFAMFTCCVAGVIVLEHLRILVKLVYRLLCKDSSEKPNMVILRCSLFLLILFLSCWIPLNYISYLYLNPSGIVYQEYYYKLAQWLCIFPLLHTSLIDPVVYALSQKEYTETITSSVLALCPFALRWELKWKLRRLNIFHRRIKEPKVVKDALPTRAIDTSTRERPFSITSDVIEMDQMNIDFPIARTQQRNGHVNLGYYSEYI